MLCDWQIRKFIGGDQGNRAPCITPYREENLQPASLDCRLSNEFIRFTQFDLDTIIDFASPPTEDEGVREVVGEIGFLLGPGEFALGATEEFIDLPLGIGARIEGKSSIGRRGLFVHVTAGFIDPGFNGRITLELYNVRNVPMILRPGMDICQLGFFAMRGTPEHGYNGRYQGAQSVQSSRFGREM